MKRPITLYRRALRILPAPYYDRYAEPMAQTLEDMLSDQPTAAARRKVWLRAILDLPVTTAHQYVEVGGTTMHHAPNYAKQGTLLSALLLVPFFVIITLNSLHPLAQSLHGIGYVSVFVLPVISLLLSLATLSRLLIAHELLSRIKNYRQLQRNWILFLVPMLALATATFAFGHDSVHCVAAGKPGNIVQCVRNS